MMRQFVPKRHSPLPLVLSLLALSLSFPAAPPAVAQSQSSRRTPVVVVAEKVSPAVVNIAAESIVRDVDPFFIESRPASTARR